MPWFDFLRNENLTADEAELLDEAEQAQERELAGEPFTGQFCIRGHGDGTYTVDEEFELFPDAANAPTDDLRLRGWLGIK